MVKAYINVEKEHEKVISCLNSYDLNSVDLGKIATQNEVHLVCTSFSMFMYAFIIFLKQIFNNSDYPIF